MGRITITIDTEYIPDRFTGWPDVSIVLRCRPKDKHKAELVADLIAGMDCFDIEPVTQSITGETNDKTKTS
jgi:hypothetical protein